MIEAAFLLRANGRDPGFLIGGVPQDPPVGNHLGAEADPFVIEGDEYDSAFFDKRSKFIHYAPHIAVLNNLEFDHADIFRDLEDYKRTFVHFTRLVPHNGFVVMNGDDTNLRSLGPLPWTRVVRVGTGENNDLRVTDFAEDAAGVVLTAAAGAWAKTGAVSNTAMIAAAPAMMVSCRPPMLTIRQAKRYTPGHPAPVTLRRPSPVRRHWPGTIMAAS